MKSIGAEVTYSTDDEMHVGTCKNIRVTTSFDWSCRNCSQVESAKNQRDEALLTADAYRIAFEEQLSRNRALLRKLVEIQHPRKNHRSQKHDVRASGDSATGTGIRISCQHNPVSMFWWYLFSSGFKTAVERSMCYISCFATNVF
jgi:hypothetical protein